MGKKSKEKRFVLWSVYRVHVYYSNSGGETGEYMDILCDNESGGGLIIFSNISGKYISGGYKKGERVNMSDAKKVQLIAEDLKSYNYKPPIVIKEVIKEKLVDKEVLVRVDYYEDTLIDALYNWYCRKRDRYFDDKADLV